MSRTDFSLEGSPIQSSVPAQEARHSTSTDCTHTHRSKDGPWPPLLTVSLDGRNVAACPTSPEPPYSLGAGSHCVQTSPNVCENVYQVEGGRRGEGTGGGAREQTVNTSIALNVAG